MAYLVLYFLHLSSVQVLPTINPEIVDPFGQVKQCLGLNIFTFIFQNPPCPSLFVERPPAPQSARRYLHSSISASLIIVKSNCSSTPWFTLQILPLQSFPPLIPSLKISLKPRPVPSFISSDLLRGARLYIFFIMLLIESYNTRTSPLSLHQSSSTPFYSPQIPFKIMGGIDKIESQNQFPLGEMSKTFQGERDRV